MSFEIMYPSLFSGKASMMGVQTEVHQNANDLYLYMVNSKAYVKSPKSAPGKMRNMGLFGFESLFGDVEPYQVSKKADSGMYLGKKAYAVAITVPGSIALNVVRRATIFVDTITFLPLGFDEDDPTAGGVDHSVYKSLTPHAHLTKKDFDWTPPKGAKSMQSGN